VTFVVLFLLAVIWAVYLASWIRSRTEHRSVNSISSFNKHLSVLERTSPARQGLTASPTHRPTAPYSGPVGMGAIRRHAGMTLSEARRRRRDVLYTLGGVALVTLMLAVVVGGSFIWLHLFADALLLTYVGLLLYGQRLASERRNKVRYLPPMGAVADLDTPYLVPQSASAN
jgi:hypothetical protein